MAKFHGFIGFFEMVDTAPGVSTPTISDIPCKGDILRNRQRTESSSSENLNDNITINNRFSVIADAYMYTNIVNIKYLEWNGIKWKVIDVDIQRPRLILTVRGVWNE